MLCFTKPPKHFERIFFALPLPKLPVPNSLVGSRIFVSAELQLYFILETSHPGAYFLDRQQNSSTGVVLIASRSLQL